MPFGPMKEKAVPLVSTIPDVDAGMVHPPVGGFGDGGGTKAAAI